MLAEFNESMDISGCYVLVSENEIIHYEIVLSDNVKEPFLPVTDGVWKFTFKVDNSVNGIASYSKEKIDYASVENELMNVYKTYVPFDSFETPYDHISHLKNTCKALQALDKIESRRFQKYQLIFKNTHSPFIISDLL